MSDSLVPAVTAMSGGVREPVGWFRYQVVSDTWTWSPGLFQIHGFLPGEIVPTSAVFVAHKHPDDRSHTEEVMAAVLATGQPYCCRHRIIDARQRKRTVVTIGQGTVGQHGAVTDVHGYFVDITDAQRAATQADIELAVAASAATRADIEQAKGALMLVHGITAVDAFAVLRWHSQHANIQSRALARMITDGISSPTAGETPNQRISRLLGGLVAGYTDKWQNPPTVAGSGRSSLEPSRSGRPGRRTMRAGQASGGSAPG
jgi:hypothetical protein